MALITRKWRHRWRTARGVLFGTQVRLWPRWISSRVRGGVSGKNEVIAGLSVSLLAAAQGLAFASMAGLPPSYGLTGAAVAAIVGPFFASSPQTILGPTNATAFMIFSALSFYPEAERVTMMPPLLMLVALMLFLGAHFRLADLVQYVSRSVLVGYLAGSALLIIVNQLPPALGLSASAEGGATSLVGQVMSLGKKLPQAEWGAVAISSLTLLTYAMLRWWRPRWPSFALALALGTVAAWMMMRFGGLVVRTLPVFSVHDLLPVMPDWSDPTLWPQISRLFGVAVAVAFLASLESSLMAKSLSHSSGAAVNLNQEMYGVGVATLASSALSGMPVSASLTRSALNQQLGARTGWSSVVSGLACAALALAGGHLIPHIPRAALSVLVIAVAFSLVNRRQLIVCWRATHSDAATLLGTFLATLLLPLHNAIFVGVAMSIVLYLRKAAQPQLVEYEFNQRGDLTAASPTPRQNPEISIVHVEGELFFGAAEVFRTQMQRISADAHLSVIILRLKNARRLDATSVLALEELILRMRENQRHLLISGAMKEVYRVLMRSGIVDLLGRDNIFLGSIRNPNLSTRRALKRAQDLLGQATTPEVTIFYDPTQKSSSDAM
jgi:sulfate permease, SulP family